jgi:sulfoxide reductase catalytic subunit YedY
MRLVERQPATVWNSRYPKLATFWGNVNPAGATSLFGRGLRERRDGDLLSKPAQRYNGYADHVAALYAGMNPAEMY